MERHHYEHFGKIKKWNLGKKISLLQRWHTSTSTSVVGTIRKSMKWATGKMQYNQTRSIQGRYRFWEFAVSVYMVWCAMQWLLLVGLGLSLGVEVGWLFLCLCMKFSYHFICFTRLWMGIGVPGDPKVNFWVSVGYRSGYRSGECLAPGNFDNRTRAVQEHASTTFDAAGRFCRNVLCSSVYYSCLQSYTCLLLIYQVKVSVLGVHCIGFHAFKA